VLIRNTNTKLRLYGDTILTCPMMDTIVSFDDNLREFVSCMFEMLPGFFGVGLAAPQIGEAKRIAVIDLSIQDKALTDKLVLINPILVKAEGTRTVREGCLSLPGYWEDVQRPEKVTVAAFDEFGNEYQKEADGLLAHCICHEVDHLNGLLVDRLIAPDRWKVIYRQFRRWHKEVS
jgi:peptide deformylase